MTVHLIRKMYIVDKSELRVNQIVPKVMVNAATLTHLGTIKFQTLVIQCVDL